MRERGEKRSIKHQIRSIGTTEYTRAHLEAGLGSWCERNTSFCAINNTRFLFLHGNLEPAVGGCPPPHDPNRNRRAHARATPAHARHEVSDVFPDESSAGVTHPPPRPRPRHHYRALPAKSPETPKSRPCVLEVRVDDLGGPRGPGGFGPPRRSRSQQPRGATTPHRRADRDA